jgi:type I restriction enzyme S subunit
MIKDWQIKTLGDVCEMYQPKTISSKEMVEDGAYAVYGANGVIGRYNQFNHEEPQLLITCRGATCGSVNISAPRSWITGNAMVVRPKNPTLEMRYLEYLFHGGIDISKAITGSAQPQITRSNLEPIEIAFPESLSEQRRIVAVLDEAFAGIAVAKANAEQNLKNARALFESHLNAIFTNPGPGWTSVPLGEVSEFKNGLNFTRESKGQSLQMVGVGDFQDHSVIPLNNLQTITIDGKLPEDYLIQAGDILTVRSNGSRDLVGRTMIVPDEIAGRMVSFSGFIIRVRCDKSKLRPRFLLSFLKSRSTRDLLTGEGGGANISNINQAKLSRLSVRVPPLQQQERIADQIEQLTEQAKSLADIYERKLTALGDLQKSLLHKAFSGEL